MRTSLCLKILILIFACSIPGLVAAAALININTADVSLLETLPGIGATKAAAIVEYRTQHGSFATTKAIENVSGIGASTYAEIASLITVGDAQASGDQATTTTPVSQSAGVPTVPAGAWIDLGGDVTLTQHVPHTFRAQVRTKSNTAVADTDLRWSFGDGSSGVGTTVQKTFSYVGTYVVTAFAMRGVEKIQGSILVKVVPPSVHIDSISSEGIMITNDSNTLLDLSGWRLVTDAGFFAIPEGTEIAPNANILFPWSITRLPISFVARLTYPSGEIATQYQPKKTVVRATSSVVQPQLKSGGSYTVQTPTTVAITSQQDSVHEATGALAPATTSELAAAGAALPPEAKSAVTAETSSVGAIVSSPWSLGFLGMLAVSVGAFILL